MPRGRDASQGSALLLACCDPEDALGMWGKSQGKAARPAGRQGPRRACHPSFTERWLSGNLIVLVNHSLCRRGVIPIYSAVQGIKIKKPCSHFCHVPSASPTFNRLHNEAIPGLLALLSLVNNLL